MSDESFSYHPEKNNRQLTVTEISVPKKLIGPSEGKESRDKDLINYLIAKLPQEYMEVFQTQDFDGVAISPNYAFRGVRREQDFPGIATDLEKSRFSGDWAKKKIVEQGHEMTLIGDEKGEILTTSIPEAAIGFARPSREQDIGYLIVYDNKDGSFNHNSRTRDWVHEHPVNSNETLVPKVVAVIELKPEERSKGFWGRIGRLLLPKIRQRR